MQYNYERIFPLISKQVNFKKKLKGKTYKEINFSDLMQRFSNFMVGPPVKGKSSE